MLHHSPKYSDMKLHDISVSNVVVYLGASEKSFDKAELVEHIGAFRRLEEKGELNASMEKYIVQHPSPN